MNTSNLFPRIAVIAAFSSVIAACAASPPPPANRAMPLTVESSSQALAPAPVPVRSPVSSIALSEDLCKACGIREDDAHFSFDSSVLRQTDVTPLNELAVCLLSGPLQGRSIRLLGRADPRGDTDYNMALGQSRADSVGAYLGGRGVDSARRPTSSRGAMDAKGTDEQSWKEDRRVDLTLAN